ncbi:AP-4 complex accessory subunit Tepsin isoform X1 [Carcharodon carcharias]|uniref:AP-4 complex accessory subunit Tepsin isoform X1 n=2 Tax=Carcharodon carcharias TaxID=13397 RepID=UPI001B7E87CD|nr:AP-4 complex accessory subunit Tepsin isoform X1 [Carcharodon carcharias]
MATVGEKLGFLQRLPMLMKATSDDEVPCPGYLFEEIAKISHESVGLCQCLLEYLLERLQSHSCYVKLKVLKILRHVCNHGSPQFILELRRNATLIQEVTVFSGPPDLLHGNALYQRVRTTAEDLANLLFSDALPYQTSCTLSPSRPYPQTGMGSSPSSGSIMQGFGHTAGKIPSGSASDAILNKIQKAAEAMANAVLPQDCPKNRGNHYHAEGYQPVLSTASEAKELKSVPKSPVARHSTKAIHHQPGLPGGGWEESDSGHSSQDSSQTNYISDGSNSKTGTDSQSGGSRESGDLMERVESINLNDCVQEITLVNNLTQGSKVFLTRDEMLHFIKECGLLNCEVVVELLNEKLKDPSDSVNMRSMSILSTLMCSDLLSHDQIFAITHKCLQQLSEGGPGPVTSRATKILRQFQALEGSKLAARGSALEIALPISSDTLSCNAVTPLTNFTSGLKGKVLTDPLHFHPGLEKIPVLEKSQGSSLCLPPLSQETSISQENQGPVFPSLSLPEVKTQHTEKVTEISSDAVDTENSQPHSEAQIITVTQTSMTEQNLHCEQHKRITAEPKLQSVQCQSTASEDTTDSKLSLFADMVLVVHETPSFLKPCLNQGSSREMHTLAEQNKIPVCITTEVKIPHGNLGNTDSECNQTSVFSFLNTSSSSHSI